MRVAVTGATGFLGRYIVARLAESNHQCRCWYRESSDRGGFGDAEDVIEWVPGSLETQDTFAAFCEGVDAVVHSGLYRPAGLGFRAAGQEAFDEFLSVNLGGSLSLMSAARRSGTPRFVFISTCAVHEIILSDRPLDERHPLWATTHYGAHKAAIEKFVHSFGHGEEWPVCALRPTGIYGLAHPPTASRWYEIVQRVCNGEPFSSDRGGKEVHAADVAKAVDLLLHAEPERMRGEAFNCYDRYIAENEVARLAREISGSASEVDPRDRTPKNQIDTTKIRNLGMEFGGDELLRHTIEQMVRAISNGTTK